jgi:hypothetical protein
MDRLRAPRWKTIIVIGCDGDGMQTVVVDGKGGLDAAMPRAKQARRRLTLASVEAQAQTGPANWTFEPSRVKKRSVPLAPGASRPDDRHPAGGRDRPAGRTPVPTDQARPDPPGDAPATTDVGT